MIMKNKRAAKMTVKVSNSIMKHGKPSAKKLDLRQIQQPQMTDAQRLFMERLQSRPGSHD